MDTQGDPISHRSALSGLNHVALFSYILFFFLEDQPQIFPDNRVANGYKEKEIDGNNLQGKAVFFLPSFKKSSGDSCC